VIVFGTIAAFAVELILLGYDSTTVLGCVVPSILLGLTAIYTAYGAHQQMVLRRSNEEILRLATLSERERIGRDLHDLLGHTLSVIALKSELARKLIDRDLDGARREIGEVELVARDALAQYRITHPETAPLVDAYRALIRVGLSALTNDVSGPARFCEDALRHFRVLALPFEEALATIVMATLLDPAEPEVRAAAAAAREILTRLGATPFILPLDAAMHRHPSVEVKEGAGSRETTSV
jgi:two-component system sensor histidine kinase DesK